jgi:hypothetical protein
MGIFRTWGQIVDATSYDTYLLDPYKYMFIYLKRKALD